jgi:hypothetical protein
LPCCSKANSSASAGAPSNRLPPLLEAGQYRDPVRALLAKAARASQTMFTMKKLDIAKIRQAYEHG